MLFLHSSGAWCAAPPGFRSLLLDPIGVAKTRVEAVHGLLCHPEFVERSSKGEWPPCMGLGAFIEVPAPDCAEFAGSRSELKSSQDRAERRRQAFRIVEGGFGSRTDEEKQLQERE
jgi:hypothetical protein